MSAARTQTRADVDRTLFEAQAGREAWLYRESVAAGSPNGWHLLRIVQLAAQFKQPVPESVRDHLAAMVIAMQDGDEPAVALQLRDVRGGSPRNTATAAAARARYLRWLSAYLPVRLGGAVEGADDDARFTSATAAFKAAAKQFGVGYGEIKKRWYEYRRAHLQSP